MNYFDMYLIEKTQKSFNLLDSGCLLESMRGGVFEKLISFLKKIAEKIKDFFVGKKENNSESVEFDLRLETDMFNKRESRIKKIFNVAKPFLVSAAVVGTSALAVSKHIEKNNERVLDMNSDKENKLFIKGSELMETLDLLRHRQRDEEETYRQVKEKMNTTQRAEAESLLNKYQSLIEKMSYQLNELNKYAYKNPNEYGLRITKSKKAYEKFNEVLSEVNLLLNDEVKGLVRGSNKIMQILKS